MSANYHLKRYAAIMQVTENDAPFTLGDLFAIEVVRGHESEVKEYCEQFYPFCKLFLVTELDDVTTKDMVLAEYELMLDEQIRLPDEYYHNINKGEGL